MFVDVHAYERVCAHVHACMPRRTYYYLLLIR